MNALKRLGSGYASVAATVALVLALGMGGAYAAGKIGSKKIAVGAVNSKHIKDGQVRTADLAADAVVGSAQRANRAETADSARTAASADVAKSVAPNAVTSAEVADGSLGGVDLGNDSINAPRLQDDSVGTSEIADRSVDRVDLGFGSVGRAELGFASVGGGQLGQITAVVSSSGTGIGSGEFGNASVSCPAGATLLNGGFAWQDDEANSIIYSAPAELAAGKAWEVRGYVPSGSNTLYAWASCLQP